MSNLRQIGKSQGPLVPVARLAPALKANPPEADIRVWGLAQTYSHGYQLPFHRHDSAQLIYASSGVMSVHTEVGAWVVPPHRAVWVPPNTEHRIAMSGEVSMRTLYLSRELRVASPSECSVVNVSPLLRELVLHAVQLAPLYVSLPEHARLIGVLLDQIERLAVIPLNVPAPRDPRARRAAEFLQQHPGEAASLEQIARRAGASKRTLERLFQRDTGMSFGAFREQVRLLAALALLAGGAPVTQVALEVGYESPSAFIARFRQLLGTTPGRYYRDSRGDSHPAV
jgi:AraC-like DNA-binding protein